MTYGDALRALKQFARDYQPRPVRDDRPVSALVAPGLPAGNPGASGSSERTVIGLVHGR